MKCLSLKQPFADLVVLGKKTIELRFWNTSFRGEFLVPASGNVNGPECIANGYDPRTVTRRAIIGKAVLYDVKIYKSKEEFMADKSKHLAGEEFSDCRYGFLLKDPVKFDKPIPMPGKLNFFEVDIDG